MPYSIRKSFTFAASHILCGLPEGHPCGRLHGHNYRVTLELSGPDEALSPVGFLRDYRDLQAFKDLIDGQLDHRHLNEWRWLSALTARPDVAGSANPTAENLAYALYRAAEDMYPGLVAAVAVEETEKTWAEYRPYRPPMQRAGIFARPDLPPAAPAS